MPSRAPVVVAALALLPSAAQAAEPWGPARTVDRAGGAVLGDPAVAVDERGYVVAAWTRRSDGLTRLLGARRTPRRGFASPFVLDGPRARVDRPAVEFDGRRTALVAYRRSSAEGLRVGATTVRASGARTRRIVFVDSRSPGEPRFADPPFDRPLLAWSGVSGDRDVQLAESDVGGDFDATVRFDLDDVIGGVSVATEPRGRALLAYVQRTDGDPGGRVVVARRAAGTTSFSVRGVSRPGAVPRDAAVAVGEDGRALVAWREGDAVVAAQRAAGTDGFSSPRVIGANARDQVRVTATSSSRFVVTWRSAAREVHGTVLGAPARRISRPGVPVQRYVIRADDRGGATVAWLERPTSDPGAVVRAVALTPSGSIGSIQRLSPSGRRAGSLALGVGARGDAVALWTDLGGDRLRAARRPD